MENKPQLTFWQIWNMSFGFLGIQFGWGLQMANMSPIYKYLGADEAILPYLWLAGPLTGLLVQPIVGAMSDRTWTRLGRRRPFFLVGAVIASICLVLMPNSSTLWMGCRTTLDNGRVDQYHDGAVPCIRRRYDLDGFRCDVAGFVPTDFWETARAEVDKVKADTLWLAEWNRPTCI